MPFRKCSSGSRALASGERNCLTYVNDVAGVDPVVRNVQDRERVQQTKMLDVGGLLQVVVRQVQGVQELEVV